MRHVRYSLVALSCFALTAAVGSAGHAATLLGTPLTTTVGPGTASAVAATPAPNNYPTAAPSNNLTVGITLNTAAAPLDLVLAGINSNGTTEYLVTSTVANATGVPFIGYSFQLGTGTGANFTPLTANGITPFFFNTPPPTSNNFSTANLTPELLTFTGGTIASGGVSTFTYSMVIPDQAATPFTFTLRETPLTVPEPGSMALLIGMSASGAGFLVRRRKRVNKAA